MSSALNDPANLIQGISYAAWRAEFGDGPWPNIPCVATGNSPPALFRFLNWNILFGEVLRLKQLCPAVTRAIIFLFPHKCSPSSCVRQNLSFFIIIIAEYLWRGKKKAVLKFVF